MNIFGQPRVARQVKAPPPPGHFSADMEQLDWQNCREHFAWAFTSETEGFYFSHEWNQGERVVYFVKKLEDILGLDIRTRFCFTNLPFAIWVGPSIFWKECKMRRSLFTIFLRVGLNYDPAKENFERVLLSDPYVRDTENAVLRFLYGFTDCRIRPDYEINGVGKGWRDYFKERSIEFIRRSLVLPAGSNYQPVLFGAGCLWN